MQRTIPMVFNGMINVPIIEIIHKGYVITAKLDMDATPWQSSGNTYRNGYIVVKDGTLAMPRGVWFSSVIEARASIDILIKSEGNVQKFWSLLQEQQGLSECKDV
jgi:hypothetical protein